MVLEGLWAKSEKKKQQNRYLFTVIWYFRDLGQIWPFGDPYDQIGRISAEYAPYQLCVSYPHPQSRSRHFGGGSTLIAPIPTEIGHDIAE